MKMFKSNKSKLAASIGVCLGAGFFGSAFTMQRLFDWYPYIEKPWFNPPNWVFAPVWTVLYIIMGISLYLFWSTKKKDKREARDIFTAQLILNVVWSILFFGLKNPPLAFVGILLLWVLIAATIAEFYKISKTAGLILFPYLFWVTFAGILNAAIVSLN